MAISPHNMLNRSTKPAPTLVLGIGNILLRDEGVGVHVVRALEQQAWPTEIELFDGATAGIDLLDTLADRRHVLIIDAMQHDSPPGTVLRLSPADLAPSSGPAVSLHEAGLLEALRAAEQLGCAPQQVVILGIQPYEISVGLELSAPMRALLPRLTNLVRQELKELGCAACTQPE